MTDTGQGGMVDDWWQSAPGKIASPPTLRWESGGKSAAIFPRYAGMHHFNQVNLRYVQTHTCLFMYCCYLVLVDKGY